MNYRKQWTQTLGEALLCAALCITLVGHATPARSQSKSSSSVAAATAAYGNCPAPSTAGVRVCYPTGSEIASPMQVIASGTGARGPVKYMQLFIDGKKLEMVPGYLFDMPVDLSLGTHRVVLVEIDSTGAYQKSAPKYMNVTANTSNISCPAPGSPGVNLCMPSSTNCQVANYTTVVASATPNSGAVSRMELWVNGVKLMDRNGDFLDTNLGLQPGARVVVQAVDTNGGTVKSAPAYVNPC